jgi:CBS domain containing-hemolysin-like protein
MVWLGVLEIFLIGVLSGLWMMAIGWFIREASYAEARSSREASALGRFTCADVMTSRPDSVPTTRSIERFVDDVLSTGRHAAYTAFDSDQRVVGLMEVKSVRLTPRDAWPTTEVSAAMTPLAEVPVASADATLDVLVRRMDEHAGTRALIMDGDRLVGIVSPSDIVRLTIAVELAAGADPGPGGHATESI